MESKAFLVLDGVHRSGTECAQEFVEVPAPTDKRVHTTLHKIITRMNKLHTHRGVLVEREGSTCEADNDCDCDEASTFRPQ